MTRNKDSILFKLRVILIELIVIFMIAIIVHLIHERKEESKVYNRKNPYIIASTEDFVDFANMVCDGYSFKDEYVLMVEDIDLTDIWVPAMGARDSGHYFEGTFDGGGHVIYNIFYGVDEGDNALFGTLAGTVMNLGIESGVIQGDCCGSIASRSLNENARIVNCYNKAELYGDYLGGIAGNFDGKIINCLSMCELNYRGGKGDIICYGRSKVVNCFSVYNRDRYDTHTCEENYVRFFPSEDGFSSYIEFMPQIEEALNNGFHMLALECPDLILNDYYLWEVSDEGKTLGFSLEKYSPTKIDTIIRYILYIYSAYYPYVPILTVILICGNIVLVSGGVGKIHITDMKK